MTATVDASKLVADLAYVENLIASSDVLQATKHHVFAAGQQVSVEVEGSHWEARAWRAAFQGRILPSHMDRHGVRRQLIIAAHVEIQVVEHPRHRDEGRINVAVALIVGFVGLFLWGWSHASRTPNGAWIAAVAFIGSVVLLVATGLVRWRRRDRRDAARTKYVEDHLVQDTSGEHYLDGAN